MSRGRDAPADGITSVKARRLLRQLGVEAALARGESLVMTGPTYELRKEPGVHGRLAFVRDEDGRLCVGWASDAAGAFALVEAEPFSLRTLGYYQRHLRRTGEVGR